MPACILCQTQTDQPWSPRERVTWYQCPGCGLFYVDPQPDDDTLNELYKQAYWGKPVDPEGRGEASERRVWGGRARDVTSVHAPGRVLDVGCGKAMFMRYAAELGWSAWGTEVDAAAVEVLPEDLRGRIHIGTVEDLPEPDEPFDVITMWDVIEHVRDPVGFLRATHRVLKPGGLLVVTTPNPRTLKNRLRGTRCKYFVFERYLHLYHFTKATLAATYRAAGFEPVRWLRSPSGTPLYLAGRRV